LGGKVAVRVEKGDTFQIIAKGEKCLGGYGGEDGVCFKEWRSKGEMFRGCRLVMLSGILAEREGGALLQLSREGIVRRRVLNTVKRGSDVKVRQRELSNFGGAKKTMDGGYLWWGRCSVRGISNGTFTRCLEVRGGKTGLDWY